MNRARSPRETLAQIIATAGGIGYAKVAPGTFGTAAALPLAFGGGFIAPVWFFAATILISLAGIWASTVMDHDAEEHDAGHIVIDEVAGYLITCAFIDRTNPWWLLAAFVVFRVLDIWKPFPISVVDRKVGGGFGVMADDLLAGVVGAALLYGARWVDWSSLLA